MEESENDGGETIKASIVLFSISGTRKRSYFVWSFQTGNRRKPEICYANFSQPLMFVCERVCDVSERD